MPFAEKESAMVRVEDQRRTAMALGEGPRCAATGLGVLKTSSDDQELAEYTDPKGQVAVDLQDWDIPVAFHSQES